MDANTRSGTQGLLCDSPQMGCTRAGQSHMDGGARGAPQQATGQDFTPIHPAGYRSHNTYNHKGATRQRGQGAGRTSRGGRPTGGGGGA